MKSKDIKLHLLWCDTLEDLNISWEYYKKYIPDEDKEHFIEVKNIIKGALENKNVSNDEQNRLNEWYRNLLTMSPSEKKKLLDLNIKKLKYYGAI